MKNFEYQNDEQARKVLSALPGKKIKCMVTALEVWADVESFEETEHSFILRGTHTPINWGGDIFTKLFLVIRKGDGFGGKYLKY